MRKSFLWTLFIIALLISFGMAWAVQREHDYIEVTFGENLHKDYGIHLNHLLAQWDDDGIKFIRCRITPWKGLITYRDMFVVNDGKILYRHSENRQLDVEMHYQLTAKKFYEERVYLTPPVKPFGYEGGEIWWIVSYIQEGEKKV